MTDNSRMTNAERQARYRLANGHRSIGVTGPTREAIGRVQELLPSASMDAIPIAEEVQASEPPPTRGASSAASPCARA